MNELRDQTVDLLNFREPKTETFSRRLAFDTVPQIDVFQPDGFTREEHKMIFETQKILGKPELPVCATCVRVPVFVSHAMSVNVEFSESISLEAAKQALSNADGVIFSESPEEFPVAADAVTTMTCNRCLRSQRRQWFGFLVCVGRLRKGAATNAVQIPVLTKWAG